MKYFFKNVMFNLIKDLICSTNEIEKSIISDINNTKNCSNTKITYNSTYDISIISFEYKKYNIEVHKNIFNEKDSNLIFVCKNGYCGDENYKYIIKNIINIENIYDLLHL